MGTTLKFFRRTKMAASPSENRPEMNELHPAPQSSSHLESMEAYKAMYEESISDPEAFWGELANSYITWHRPFNKVLHGGFNEGDVAWFSGGELNVSENCLDRHLDERGDKVADTLVRNINFLGESLARHIYGYGEADHQVTVFEGYNGVDAQLVASWIDYLAGAPRMAPLIPDDAPFLAGFERSLAQYTDEASRFSTKLNIKETLYTSAPQVMTVHKVKSTFFDLGVLLAALAYVAGVFVLLKGSDGVAVLMDLVGM